VVNDSAAIMSARRRTAPRRTAPEQQVQDDASSITRFVDAIMKMIEFVHDAPRAKSARDIALAA